MFDGGAERTRLARYREVAAQFHSTFVGNGKGTDVLDYLERAYVKRPSFNVNHPDEKSTFYREGERGLVLAILQWIDWHEHPEKLEQWLKRNQGVEDVVGK